MNVVGLRGADVRTSVHTVDSECFGFTIALPSIQKQSGTMAVASSGCTSTIYPEGSMSK